MTIEVRERGRQLLGIWNDDIAALPEDAGEGRLRFVIDGDTEHGLPETARLAHGHVRILDPVPALIVIEVVWLSIRENEQQAPLPRPLGKVGRGMPDGRAKPRIVPWLEPRDACFDGRVHGLVERFAALDEHAVAPQGRESING